MLIVDSSLKKENNEIMKKIITQYERAILSWGHVDFENIDLLRQKDSCDFYSYYNNGPKIINYSFTYVANRGPKIVDTRIRAKRQLIDLCNTVSG